jgi:hypothetical protein
MLAGEDAVSETALPPLGLPHERFLLAYQHPNQALPLAPILMLGLGVPLEQVKNGVYACLQAIHLHATRDHLILTNPALLALSPADATALFTAAKPLLEEDFGTTPFFPHHTYWFVKLGLVAADFVTLNTHSTDQAHGRNIDWWSPRDTTSEGVAKRWRKLQNEIQMLWHIDSTNDAREEQGLPRVNSIWLSGIGALADIYAPPEIKGATTLIGDHLLLAGLAQYLNKPYMQENDGLASDFTKPNNLLVGAFAWLNKPAQIWPQLCAALLARHLDEIAIIDFPNTVPRERIFTRNELLPNKGLMAMLQPLLFWRSPTSPSWEDFIGKNP